MEAQSGETTLSSVAAHDGPHFSPPANAQSHGHKPRDFLSGLARLFHSKQFLFVAIIFILALAVRWYLARFELFFEFDSYWHARMVSYILQGMPVPMVDPLAYYQNIAAATITNPPLFFWYLSALIYKVFTLNAPYNFDLWVFFVKLIPALFGALTSVAMYFLGKELFRNTPHEKSAGVIAGIIAAVMPAFVYRTMGGFFEDDSLGFLWMVIGFVFFVRAVRNPEWKMENIGNAILAGIGFGLMALSWSAFNQLIPILLGIGFLQFILWTRENELQKAKEYAALWFVTFIILAAAATFQVGVFWLTQLGGILGNLILHTSEIAWWQSVIGIIIFFGIAAALWIIQSRKLLSEKLFRAVFTIVVLGTVLMPLLIAVLNISFQTGDVLGQSVGEESAGKTFF